MSRPLLILRPLSEADATAERARDLGLNPHNAPLFGGASLAWEGPSGDFDAMMITSANAIRFGGSQLAAFKALPLYAVGTASAAAAAAAGFSDVRAGDGGVDAMLTRIEGEIAGRVFYPAARERTAHLSPKFELVTVTVYAMDALAQPAIPPTGVALVHSTRAAERFAEIAISRAAYDIVAISAKAADGAGAGWRSVQWPTTPTDAAMLALAAPLCEG
jgi:uroporphyrinogen-III synthase